MTPDGECLRVSAHDRMVLTTWARSRTLAARVVLRSRIVLSLADGEGVTAVADRLGIARATVRLWRQRFSEHGPEVLLRDAPGRGRRPLLDAAARQRLRDQSGRLPVREHALALGVSAATVSRWRKRRD